MGDLVMDYRVAVGVLDERGEFRLRYGWDANGKEWAEREFAKRLESEKSDVGQEKFYVAMFERGERNLPEMIRIEGI